MVVLLDLDLDHDGDDEGSGHQLSRALQHQLRGFQELKIIGRPMPNAAVLDHRSSNSRRSPNTPGAGLLASALACYPIALSLASRLDLNDLFALSSTCHDVHDCLIQFAQNLRGESLRCVNDRTYKTPSESDVTRATLLGYSQSSEEHGFMISELGNSLDDLVLAEPTAHLYHGGSSSMLGLTGKISQCARDFVSPCRKCGVVICRNCAVKPPSARCLPDRFRRLCQTCLEAPLSDHLDQLSEKLGLHDSPTNSRASSSWSVHSVSGSSSTSFASAGAGRVNAAVFTAPAFLRTPCECDSRGVYLCQPCGQNLSAANTTYKRVWTWRSRYSTHIGGGLGTGLGQGEQGQKCGRGNHCLEKGAAGVCWMEIECSEARSMDPPASEYFGSSQNSTPNTSDLESELSRSKPGYFSQEMEGIGGVVRKKVRKRIKVGATVYEFDDERESGRYLERESSGQIRSWCGWCFRVCPGAADRTLVAEMLCT